MSNPNVVATIIQAARQRGADPVALLATALQETGGNIRYNAIGDNGTSFGPFQYHIGGALGSHTPQWGQSQAEIFDEAGRFAHYQIHGGKGAAALQRPADPTGYASGVDQYINQARALYQGAGGAGGTAGGTTPPQTMNMQAPQAPQAPPPTPINVNLPASAFNGGTRFLQEAATNLAARTHQQAPQIPQPQIPRMPQLVVQAPAPVSTVDVPLNQPGHPNERVAGPTGTRVVNLARHYLGTAYKWGGASPATGFDCSGFAQWLYAQQGVKLPRVAADQFNVGQHVTMNQLRPGDLVFFRDSTGIHHEGIAIGGGQFIHAPHTGDVVKISSLSDPYYAQQFAGGRRVG